MKIAMIGGKRVPSREGGIEVVIEELATRMVEAGHQVDVYNRRGRNVLDKDSPTYQSKTYRGIRLVSVPTFEARGLNALVYSWLAPSGRCLEDMT